MNGLIKIPMQFLILLIGVLVFIFYQFHESPIFFNKVEITQIKNSIYKDDYKKLEQAYVIAYNENQSLSKCWNQLILHSSNPKVLIMNDDVSLFGLFRPLPGMSLECS